MAVDNLAIAKATTYSIRSLHDFHFKKSVMNKLYKSYGDGFQMLDILRSLNYWYPIKNETLTAEEENRDTRTITIGASNVSVGGSPGATASFELHADDLDSENNYYPRVNFFVLCGSTVDGFVQARINSLTSDGASPTETITVVIEPVRVTDTLSSTYIAAGKVLAIMDSAFAVETTQPEPTSVGYSERTFYAQILKESIKFGGMELAKQKWVEVEGIGFFNKEFARVEFKLDRQEELALLMGQPNTNSLTQTSSMSSSSVPVYKNKGVYTWIDELGGEINYAGTTGIAIDDLDEASEYLQSQGITSDIVIVLCGAGYMRRVENGALIQVGNPAGESGGGGSLPDAFLDKIDTRGGKPGLELNIGFRTIKKGGLLFVFHTLPAFSDPMGLGADAYMLNDIGIMFPISKVKDRKSGISIPNLSARYIANGGYSRKRVVGKLGGMDGFMQGMGFPIISEIDGNSTHWLSHVMFPFLEAYKGVLHKRNS